MRTSSTRSCPHLRSELRGPRPRLASKRLGRSCEEQQNVAVSAKGHDKQAALGASCGSEDPSTIRGCDQLLAQRAGSRMDYDGEKTREAH